MLVVYLEIQCKISDVAPARVHIVFCCFRFRLCFLVVCKHVVEAI